MRIGILTKVCVTVFAPDAFNLKEGRVTALLIDGKKIVVVLPAYNAEKTLEPTVRELPAIVDKTIHDRNRGYGGNQKTCYAVALASGADFVVMIHPDYQYSPLPVTAIAGMVACRVYDLALGSRTLGGGALRGGMPLYRYVANRALTAFRNMLTGALLSEYHTGYRAFSRGLLLSLPPGLNSDDFVFDHQILAQAIYRHARIQSGSDHPGSTP